MARIIGILAAAGAAALTLAACVPPPSEGAGRADYQALCAGCHGDSGRGDGPVGRDLNPPPADLTQLAARNGGTFPTLAVMAQIDGYTHATQAMPEFGALLEGETVLYETSPGVMTPTPARLLDLANYVASLQR
jgi:mono/diheme cytochrome c family protein